MITVEQAQHLIETNIPPLRKKKVALQDALGFILASDIRASVDLPVADNSAMDGFVLASCRTHSARKGPLFFRICGDIKAGDTKKRSVRGLETWRIMTGALIPRGADTVIPKEEAIVKGGFLRVDRFIPPGQHIRRQGEEIPRGRKILKKGCLIHPATLGLLAMVGKDRVDVFEKPRVSLITTGNELVRPGRSLRSGQIYDSNAFMIQAGLEQLGIHPFAVNSIKDNPVLLRRIVASRLEQSDVLILMGGVSVGEYDYVKLVLKEAGVRTIFWRVRQKPGKPLYFGKKGGKLVFGLPGNPASAFTCFYEYVFPAIRLIAGFRHPYLPQERRKLGVSVKPDPKRTLFLKAKTIDNGTERTVIPLGYQGSHMISSLQDADCFLRIPPSRQTVREGQKVRVDFLPRERGVAL